MEYTHKVVYPLGKWWCLCCMHEGYFHYKTEYGDCGSTKTSIPSIEKYYPEKEGYVVTKLNQFTGNT